ncbi:MAG: acetyl-CoA carboxylase, carboxyltransferase subunit beta, partial [Alphaproteobacteria bacterium]
KEDVPDNLWHKCPNCEQMIFHRELAENLRVCRHCDHHFRLTADERLAMLFDAGDYTRATLPPVPVDPLKFRDTRRYTDRLKDAHAKAPADEAIVVAHGLMGGAPAVIAAFEFGFMGGSMGVAVGEGLVRASELAISQRAPLIAIPSSGGARMQEGILSLVQMPRSIVAADRVREAGLPYIVVLADPTTGGVSASFAMLGDIHIAEPRATIGFAGRRVIEDTIREELPEEFQRAEQLHRHGMVDLVVSRRDLRDTLVRVTSLLMRPGPAADIVPLDTATLDIPAPATEPANDETRPNGS